jgi:hypothetical protein
VGDGKPKSIAAAANAHDSQSDIRIGLDNLVRISKSDLLTLIISSIHDHELHEVLCSFILSCWTYFGGHGMKAVSFFGF